jgi:hypothetical protein
LPECVGRRNNLSYRFAVPTLKEKQMECKILFGVRGKVRMNVEHQNDLYFRNFAILDLKRFAEQYW